MSPKNAEEPWNSIKTRTHANLNLLLRTANENNERSKHRYRYPTELKSFSSYFRLLCGPLAYNVLQSNLNLALPALPSVNRYIKHRGCTISEGVLRCNELLHYLQDRQLPKIVSLSEDATRIVGRVQYDSRHNQLVGFVLPINQGLPTPFMYKARNASEIFSHFQGGNNVSSFMNVLMAQPMANVAPFCLLAFGTDCKYSSAAVSERWKNITSKLNELNIKVLSISSDSDPKYNSAMRRLSHLGAESNIFDDVEWFSCGNNDFIYYVQDTTHIGTKMRIFFAEN